MHILFSSRLTLLFTFCAAVILTGCKKEVHGADSSQELIDPTASLASWEYLAGISDVRCLVSDGQDLYFNRYVNGQSQMLKLDDHGELTLLFSLGASDNVRFLKYENGTKYLVQEISDVLSQISSFDEMGIIATYELHTAPMYGARVNTIIDRGSELFVAGSFKIDPISGPSWFSACMINKASGEYTPMSGLGSNGVKSSLYFNNEIYVVGQAVKGSTHTAQGRCLAKWTGTTWESFGVLALDDNLDYYSTAPSATGIGSDGSQLILGGAMDDYVGGIYTYDANSNSFQFDPSFEGTTSDWLNTEVTMKTIMGELYAFGQIRLTNSSFNTVYVLRDGQWVSIGKLDAVATDLAVGKFYAYAIVEGYIGRFTL
jgi:hypothetical protein